jgi:hypothetical protein
MKREIADEHDPTTEFQQFDTEGATVGYGDRYPTSDSPHLVVEDSNRACGVEHAHQASVHGFDSTAFGSGKTGAKRFARCLEEVELDLTDDYIRVYRDLGRGVETDYGDFYLHIWFDEGLMIACAGNPITGEGFGENHVSRYGLVSGIGIGGIESRVESAVKVIKSTAAEIKGKDPDRLFV